MLDDLELDELGSSLDELVLGVLLEELVSEVELDEVLVLDEYVDSVADDSDADDSAVGIGM